MRMQWAIKKLLANGSSSGQLDQVCPSQGVGFPLSVLALPVATFAHLLCAVRQSGDVSCKLIILNVQHTFPHPPLLTFYQHLLAYLHLTLQYQEVVSSRASTSSTQHRLKLHFQRNMILSAQWIIWLLGVFRRIYYQWYD